MTIAEVSEKYQISADTLRYYERIGLIPKVKRTAGGIRDYDEASCSWVELIKCMRSAGVPIESLIEYCALTEQGDSTITARRVLLEEEQRKLREKMSEMQETLARLDYKVNRYKEAEKTGVLSWEPK